MEYDNCCAAMGMITEIFDTETVKWERFSHIDSMLCLPCLSIQYPV